MRLALDRRTIVARVGGVGWRVLARAGVMVVVSWADGVFEPIIVVHPVLLDGQALLRCPDVPVGTGTWQIDTRPLSARGDGWWQRFTTLATGESMAVDLFFVGQTTFRAMLVAWRWDPGEMQRSAITGDHLAPLLMADHDAVRQSALRALGVLRADRGDAWDGAPVTPARG